MANVKLTADEIDAKHDEIREYLLTVVKQKRALADQMRREAHEQDMIAQRIMDAARRQEWTKLENILEDYEIELLCQCSPKDLLG